MGELLKYKVGDRVRIVSDKSLACGWNSGGLMDKWLGEVMTIRKVCSDFYLMEEDYGDPRPGAGWHWYPDMIEGLEENESTVNISAEELMNVLKL